MTALTDAWITLGLGYAWFISDYDRLNRARYKLANFVAKGLMEGRERHDDWY